MRIGLSAYNLTASELADLAVDAETARENGASGSRLHCSMSSDV